MENQKPKGTTYHLVERREIARPVPEVFAYAADFANAQHWDPGVDSARQVSEGEVGVGTKYQLEGNFGPGSVDMEYQVIAFEPDRRVVLEGRGNGFFAIDEMTFAPSSGGTVISYTADITLTNAMRFLGPVLNGTMRRMGERALDGLAAELAR